MVIKRILCPDRQRRIPKQFSWIDHRLVRDRHLCGVSHSALSLYLFLVTVSDADGLSYYSDATIEQHLNLNPAMVSQVRAELSVAGLIVYHKPLYQVLSLERPAIKPAAVATYEPPQARPQGEPTFLGTILSQAMAGGDA